jgi:hypothetical protein
MTLGTHNLFCGGLKIRLGDVDESMFNYVKRPFERIFYILGIEKRDFHDVA